MHVTVRRYQEVRGGLDDALRRQLTEGFIPIVQKAPGFITYYAVDPGDGGLVTISVFENARRGRGKYPDGRGFHQGECRRPLLRAARRKFRRGCRARGVLTAHVTT